MTERAKVLVVDDEPMIGCAIQRALGGEHEVIVADRGREALERVRGGEEFDVILCDLVMPELTGLDVFAELQRLAPAQAAAVVFMTAGASHSKIGALLDSVQNPRVDKPFDATELRALVRAQIEKRRIARATPSSHDESKG